MTTTIDTTTFGSITINGTTYDFDVLIRSTGEIEKRKKKLSKQVYGSSHTLSKDEAKHCYEEGLRTIVIGSGHEGVLHLSEEATEYFEKKGIEVILCPTPEAIKIFNKRTPSTAGLFHITC
ncbi:MAG TPA: MTH938/NDUFAF3 family protein [bacterium]|mgnify:FL=1|nr:MTH938/NDUFAF3 family protein [bacterium]